MHSFSLAERPKQRFKFRILNCKADLLNFWMYSAKCSFNFQKHNEKIVSFTDKNNIQTSLQMKGHKLPRFDFLNS